MKRPSGTKRSQTPPEVKFFTDRDLGKTFPRILREGGLWVVRYGVAFGERNVPDEEWIAFSARQGFVAISHDRNIRSDPIAIQSVMDNGARLFIVRGKHLTGPEKAELFLGALRAVHRVLQEQSSAFIGVVRRMSVAREVMKPDVKVRLTYEEWLRGKQRLADGED